MIEKICDYFKSKNVKCKIVRDNRPDYGDFIAIFDYGELNREQIVEKISENNLSCMFFEQSIREGLYNKKHVVK
jgi:hypothetical protein